MDGAADVRCLADLKTEMSRGLWCVVGPRASGKTRLCASCVPDAGDFDSGARTWLLDPVIPVAPRDFATHIKVMAAVSRRTEDRADGAERSDGQPASIVIVTCSLSQIPPTVRSMLTGVVMMRNSHVPTLKSVYTALKNTDWPKFEEWCQEIEAQCRYSAVCIPKDRFLCAPPTYFHVYPAFDAAPATGALAEPQVRFASAAAVLPSPDAEPRDPEPEPDAEPGPQADPESRESESMVDTAAAADAH